jgi:hypothetical protein
MGKQKLTFRQRLRKDAEAKLDAMITTMGAAMQLASQPVHGKTLRHDLVTKLANEAEAALEAIYNNQMDLPGTKK